MNNDLCLKIASLNCRGLNNKIKRKQIFSECESYDISCLQETYITEKTAEEWKLDWKGILVYTQGTVHSKGQIILINKRTSIDCPIEIFYETNRILGIHVTIKGDTYSIINVYGPNSNDQKTHFINSLYAAFNSTHPENMIICGDLNIVMDNDLDIIAGEKHRVKEVKMLKDFVKYCELVDSWRELNGNSRDFTWSKTNPFIARRLDYFLCSKSIQDKVSVCRHDIIYTTDHKRVHLEIQLDTFKRGKSYWKFNDSLLHDIHYVNTINECIDRHLAKNTQKSPDITWESLKSEIKGSSICYSIDKNKRMRKRENDRLESLKTLNEAIIKDPTNIEHCRKIEALKKEGGIFELNKARGAQIRSRMKWIEEGEQNTKFFLGLEKNRSGNNTIKRLKQDGHNVNAAPLTDPVDIVDHIRTYYEKLQSLNGSKESGTRTSTSLRRYLDGIQDLPSINETDRITCEEEIKLGELDKAIKGLNNNSAPGCDGLSNTFYKFFWTKIRTPLLNSFIHSIKHSGELSLTQRRGVISLLHKGKERDEIRNWRPITLTNTDYKLFSKVLANRLQPTLQDIIHTNQSGFVKGRSIESHIRAIDDLIHHASIRNIPGAIVSIDFQKAFDTVSHASIVEALTLFNFGANLINMIKVLLNNTESCIKNGGWLSNWIKIKQGIKQGCGVSPILFIITAEIMAIKIRNNSKIQPISMNNKCEQTFSTKILQYADDTTLMIRNDRSLQEALKDIQSFSHITGLKLNQQKTIAMWIGSMREKDQTLGNLSMIKNDETMKILGIHFNASREASLIERNWTEKVENLTKIVKLWQKRRLSLTGKVLICKTFLLSQLAYITKSLALPTEVLKQIDRIMFKFIWQNKHSDKKAFEKVKRDTMCKEVKQGGLSMITTSQQQDVNLIKWIAKAYSRNYRASITDEILSETKLLEDIIEATQMTQNVSQSNTVSHFWKRAINVWVDNNHKCIPIETHKKQIEDILIQPLYHNRNIKNGSSTIHFHKWAKCGITHMVDMFHSNRMKSISDIESITGVDPRTVIQYNALKKAIPLEWRRTILEANDNTTHELAMVSKNQSKISRTKYILEMPNKNIRKQMQGNSATYISGRELWRKRLGIDIEPYYGIGNLATKESRLRTLHFKILHNIYPTNIMLNRMGLKPTNKCEQCDVIDYVEHMFIHCEAITGYWDHIMKHIYFQTGVSLSKTNSNILFGITPELLGPNKIHTNKINHILLVAKMSISKHRYRSGKQNVKLIFDTEIDYRNKLLAV